MKAYKKPFGYLGDIYLLTALFVGQGGTADRETTVHHISRDALLWDNIATA